MTMQTDPISIESALAKAVEPRQEDSKYISQVRSNVKSDLIEITEDKLEIILLKHVDTLAIRTRWITPLSLFLTVLLAELTTTFSDKFGVKAAVWEAVFLLLGVGSCIWLLVALVVLWRRWKDSSLNSVIATIKNTK